MRLVAVRGAVIQKQRRVRAKALRQECPWPVQGTSEGAVEEMSSGKKWGARSCGAILRTGF